MTTLNCLAQAWQKVNTVKLTIFTNIIIVIAITDVTMITITNRPIYFYVEENYEG